MRVKINLKKTLMMVSGSKEGIFKKRVNPYMRCCKWVKTNAVLCTKCGT